ncbi:hypothetical protein Micbo1qcDRAFT_209147 [Microdochium bolleyi]|uniref:Uncharacterized protein n=1 Tax=Microdochium bolleyi TaxID=196109 RepID=A0A136INC7_9PEZI|nr:hypothetical protein Micbo1qcDRAFT_209147 [Microdochium bolleyi]
MEAKPRDGTISSARDGTVKDDYYIMQWLVTMGSTEGSSARSLQSMATQETNPAIYHAAMNFIKPEKFPTVIMTDAIGLFHPRDLSEGNYNPMLQTLCIGLNLYMVSQNCAVSRIRNPLDGSRSSSFSTASLDGSLDGSIDGTTPAAVIATGSGVQSVFTGVIFANGTVLDERPANFCSTCTYNDTTVIDHPPVAVALAGAAAIAEDDFYPISPHISAPAFASASAPHADVGGVGEARRHQHLAHHVHRHHPRT